MHDSDKFACGPIAKPTADPNDAMETLDLLEAACSLEIQKYRLLIAREARRRAELQHTADFVVHHRRAA